MKLSCLAIVLSITAIVLSLTAMTKPTRIETRELHLIDAEGRTRASLEINKYGPALTLHDENGKPRAGIIAGKKEGPGLTLHDENGEVRAMIVVSKKTGPGLLLIDPDGKVLWSAP